MPVINIALFLVMLLFGCYASLSAFELSIALLKLLPGNAKLADKNKQYFTPIWEITNVFLVFGFTSFVVFFNRAVVPISELVLTVLGVGLTALLIRAAVVLYGYYYKNSQGITTANILFVLSSITVPLSFTAAGITLLTGKQFYCNNMGWSLILTSVAGLLTLATSFALYIHRKDQHIFLYQICMFVALMYSILAAVTIQISTHSVDDRLISWPFLFWSGLVILSFITIALTVLYKKLQMLWMYFALLTLVTPVLLAFSNVPYLAFPNLQIQPSYGAEAYGAAAIIGLAAIFPIIALGFFLFTRLYFISAKGKR